MDVNVLRAFSRSHRFNDGLERLAEREKLDLNTYEYRFLQGNYSSNIGFISNMSLCSEDETIILGAPLFDKYIPVLKRLSDRHNLIFHTSWPYLDGSFSQIPARWPKQRQMWEQMLRDLPAVCVTKAAAEALEGVGANPHHIPHPVDTAIYTPNSGKPNSETDTILFVGRLVPQKGIKTLLSIADQWENTDTEFVFVGDGPLADEVRTAASKNNVRYHGYVSDDERLSSIFASADVLALPSYPTENWVELFGIVIIEAFASGTPAVATDCVGPREIIDDGKTGYLVEQQNEDALADALHRLLEDDERRAAFGERARTVAETTYDIEIVADQWLEVLQDVCSS